MRDMPVNTYGYIWCVGAYIDMCVPVPGQIYDSLELHTHMLRIQRSNSFLKMVRR